MERRTFLQAAAALPFVPKLSVPEPSVEFVFTIKANLVRPWGSKLVGEVLEEARRKGEPFELVVSAHDVGDIRMWCRRSVSDPVIPSGPVLDVFDTTAMRATGYFGRFEDGPFVRVERDAPVGLLRILDGQGKVLTYRFSELYETDRNVFYTVKVGELLVTVAAGKTYGRGLTALRFLNDPGPYKDLVFKAVYDRYQSERRPMERFDRKYVLYTQIPAIERPKGATAFVAESRSVTAIEKAERIIVPVFEWDKARLEEAQEAVLHAMGNPQDVGYVGYIVETTHRPALQGLIAFKHDQAVSRV